MDHYVSFTHDKAYLFRDGVTSSGEKVHIQTQLTEAQCFAIENIGKTLLEPPASEDEIIAATEAVELTIHSATQDILPFLDLKNQASGKITDSIVKMLAGAAFTANRKLAEGQNG